MKPIETMTIPEQLIEAAQYDGWTETHAVAGVACGIAPGEQTHRVIPMFHENYGAMLGLMLKLNRGDRWSIARHARKLVKMDNPSECTSFTFMTLPLYTMLAAYLMTKRRTA